MLTFKNQLIGFIFYQNLRCSQASSCAKTSFPLTIGGIDCNFAITALDLDYTGNIISGGSTNDYYSLGNGMGLQSSSCASNTNQLPFVKYQNKGGQEKWSKFFTSAISSYYFDQVADVKFYPTSSSSPNSAYTISLLQPQNEAGKAALVIQDTSDGRIVASQLFEEGTGFNFFSSIFLQQIDTGLSSEYLKIQTLRASHSTFAAGDQVQTFSGYRFNPSTKSLTSNNQYYRLQTTKSLSQRVHCDQFSNECYTVISKNVGSNIIKYEIVKFNTLTGTSTFKEIGSDTTSEFIMFKNSVQLNKDRFLFIGSYYDWTTKKPVASTDSPVVLIINFNQCSVANAFDIQQRRVSVNRKITMIDAKVSQAVISGSTETVKVTFAYAGDYIDESPKELDIFILDYEIQYNVNTCGQSYTGTKNMWEVDQQYLNAKIPFSIDGGILQFIGSSVYVLVFGQGTNYYVKYSTNIISYSKNVGFIDIFVQTEADINKVKCSNDNLIYDVATWDFFNRPSLSLTGSSSSLALLIASPADQNDMNDPVGKLFQLLTANDFYDSTYQTAQHIYQFSGGSSQWCSTSTAFSPQPYQMSIKSGVTWPYLYLNGQGTQDLNLGSILFNPVTLTAGQTCSNSINNIYILRTVSQSGVAGLVSTGCTSSNFQTFFSFDKKTGVFTNIKATDSTIKNCDFFFNVLQVADNLQNIAYLNFKLRILDCDAGVPQMAPIIVSQQTFSSTDNIQFNYAFPWDSSNTNCSSASNFLFYRFDCTSSSQTAITLQADSTPISNQYEVSEVPGLILGTKTTTGTTLNLKYFARQSQILDKIKVQSASLTEIQFCLGIQVTLSGTPGFSRYYYQPIQIVLTCPTQASNIAVNNAGLPKIIQDLNAVQSSVITTSLTGIFSSFSQCSLIYFIDFIEQDTTLLNFTSSYLTNQNIFLSDQVPNLKVDPQFNINPQVKVYIKACLADPVTTPLSCTSQVAAALVQIQIQSPCTTTIITEPTGFSINQIFLISTTIPQFTFNSFTSSISGCPITSVEAYNIDGSIQSDFDLSVNGLGNFVQIIAGKSQVKANYNFKLKATAQGGVTLTSTQIFTLLVECGPSSTSLVVPASFSTFDQTFIIDQITKPFYFFPSNFTSSVPACAITTISLIDQTSSILNTFFDINLQSNVTGSYFQVLTIYMLQANTILLRIQITFDGGRSEIVTKNGVQVFKLLVSCGPFSNTVSTPTITNQNFTIQQGIQPNFKFDNFIETNQNCPITSYSAYNSNLSAPLTTLGATSVVSGTQQAFMVDTLQQYIEQTFIFKIKVSVTGGQIYYTTSSYSLLVQNITLPAVLQNISVGQNITLPPVLQTISSGISYKDFNIPPYLNFEKSEIFSKTDLDYRNRSIVLMNELKVLVKQNQLQIFIFPEIITFDFDEIPIIEQAKLNILFGFSQLMIIDTNNLLNNQFDDVIFINSSNLKINKEKQYQLIFQFSENIPEEYLGQHQVSWQLQSFIFDKISGNKSLGSSFTQYIQKVSFVIQPVTNIQKSNPVVQKSKDSNQNFFKIQVQDVDEKGYAIVDFNQVKLVLKNLSLVSNKSIELLVEVNQENIDKYQFKRAKRNLGFNDSQILTNFEYEKIEFQSLKVPNFYLITIWECVLFTEQYMKLKLNFSDPDLVSLISPDTLKLKILDEKIFERKPDQNSEINYEQYIERGFTSQSRIQKTDIQNYGIKKGFSTLTTATQIIIASNMVLNTIMSQSLSQVLGFVNSLQVILHYPLIKQSITYPYEVEAFYTTAITIAQFDYLPYNYSTGLLFEFNEPEFDHEEFGQFYNLNYESYSSIVNLGSNFYYLCILAIYGIFVILLFIVQKIIELKDFDFKKFKEFVTGQKDNLMNVVPCYFIEATFEVLIASYLNWLIPIENQRQEIKNDKYYFESLVNSKNVLVSKLYFFANDPSLTIGDRLSFFSIFPLVLMILIFVPGYLIKLIVSFDQTGLEKEKKDQEINQQQNSENLQNEQDFNSEGKKCEKEPPLELQKDMRCQNYYQRAFLFLFIIRRLIFLLIVTQFDKNTQLCFMMFLNLLQTIYIASAKFYIFKKIDHIQIYNEMVVSFTLYMTLIFTDYVEQQSSQTMMGYIKLLVVIGLNFFINFILSGMSLFHKMLLVYKKVKNNLFPQKKSNINIDTDADKDREIPSSVFIMKKLNKVENLPEEKKEILKKQQLTHAQIKAKLQIIYKTIQNNKINIQPNQQIIVQYKPANYQNPDESTRRKLNLSQSRCLRSAQKLNKKIAKEQADKAIQIVPQEQLALNKIARTQRQLAKELNMSVIQEAKEPEQTINVSLNRDDLNIFYPDEKVDIRNKEGKLQ